MTKQTFVNMIATAESNNKPKSIGDNGMAGGMFQMHFAWRADYWPEWAWEVLALLDRYALEHFVAYNRDGTPRKPNTARALADLYNAGHPTADPGYDIRCLMALQTLGFTSEEFDSIVI